MSEIDRLQITNGRHIYEASQNNDLVVFVGAGVSVNSDVPDWGGLIRYFKTSLPKSLDDEHDYLKVAELYKESVPPGNYLNNVARILRDGETHFNPIHEAILQLHPSHIITTNYDDLIEQAIDSARARYSVIRSDQDIPCAKTSRYLIKMHGDFISRKIVLTETDYYNYSKDYPLLDTLVRSLFASKTILCVGFSFNDLNLKIILNKVQSILGSSAKPVYLLENLNNNPVLYKYLTQKGIQPIWLPDSIVDQYGVKAPDRLKKPAGRAVYEQLTCLQEDITKPLDIIDALYSFSRKVEGEMPFFYTSRLDKIISGKVCKWSYRYSRGIQLESSQVEELKEQWKSSAGRHRLFVAKGTKILSLIETAANNCIFEFGGINLYKLNAFKRYWNNRDKDSCSFFLDFNFRALKDRINFLERQELTYSFRDLELPYIKWMLGDLVASYDLYESLEQKYWASNNAILFFICVFNKRALFQGGYPISLYEECDARFAKSSSIQLGKVLSELNIDADIKEYLESLVNNQYYIDTFSHINELSASIISDKLRSERGGFSINSHIDELVSRMVRNIDYSFSNYIITINSACAYETHRSGIIGLVNAHLIKETKTPRGFRSSTRLDKIDMTHFKLMLVALKPDDLNQVFDSNNVDSLILDPEARIYLESLLDNLLRDSMIVKQLLRWDILLDKLKSLFILFLKSKDMQESTSKILDIAIEYDLLARFELRFDVLLNSILRQNQYAPSEIQCRKILSYLPSHGQMARFSPLMGLISRKMEERGWMIDYSFDKRMLESMPSWQLLNNIYIYYHIVPEESRNVIPHILQALSNFSDEDVPMISALIVDKHAYELVRRETLERIYRYEGDARWERTKCVVLRDVYTHIEDPTIKSLIEGYSASNPMLRFYLNPSSYRGEIDAQWLLDLDDESLGRIIKWKSVIKAIKQLDVDPKVVKRILDVV